MLWLPPAVWCQGSQSTMTGGSSCRNASMVAIIAWIAAQHALGVDHRLGHAGGAGGEQELGDKSGPTPAAAASTAGVGEVASRSTKDVAARPAGGSTVTAISVVGATAALIAAFICGPEAANTRPGLIRSMISRSLPKSCETSE